MEDQLSETVPLLRRRRHDLHQVEAAARAASGDEMEVEKWLTDLGFEQYIDQFRAAGVNLPMLATLSADEFRDTLGIRCLKHRRVLLDAAHVLKLSMDVHIKEVIPEDARALTHQMSTRLVMSWIRIAVQLLTIAVATVFLDKPSSLPVRITAGLFTIASMIVLLKAAHQFSQFTSVGDGHLPFETDSKMERIFFIFLLCGACVIIFYTHDDADPPTFSDAGHTLLTVSFSLLAQI